jgi:hypothetical protein
VGAYADGTGIAPGTTTTLIQPRGIVGSFPAYQFVLGQPGWNDTTKVFTFTHGPYNLPPVNQNFDVSAECYSGTNVVTASPVASSATTVTPLTTGSAADFVSSLGGSATAINTYQNGVTALSISLTWNFPTDSSVRQVSIDASSGGYTFNKKIYTMGLTPYGSTGTLYGTAGSITVEVLAYGSSVTITMNSLDYNGNLIAGTAPSQVFSVPAATASIVPSTIGPGTVASALTLTNTTHQITGGSFTASADSTNAFKVTNSSNNQAVSLASGGMIVSGSGALSGSVFTVICNEFTILDSNGNGVSASCTSGFGANLQVQDGVGNGWAFVAKNGGNHNLTSLASNSYISILDSYRIGSTILIDANKLHRFNSNQYNSTVGSGSVVGQVLIYDAATGSYVGYVDLRV